MDRLSSCYFCGDAVDAALEEYPLVDPRRHQDIETDQRIVLCPSCRGKLTNVIERVLESALNGEEPDVEASGVADLGDEEDLVDLDESLEQADNGEEMTATSVERVDDADGQSYSRSTAASDLSTDESGTDASDPATDEADTAEAGESAADDDGMTGNKAKSTTESTDQTATDDTKSYSKAEHNKVVKLLQNRDFPVEIEEITVVSRSAYGIDRDTTHAIIESLIERGVVEDQGDRLVRA
jgi:hypothetical protein